MPHFLADTTIWTWAKREAGLRERLAERVGRGELLTCVPIVLEVLHSARTGDEYEQNLAESFGPAIGWLPLSQAAGERALELQRLASTTHGAHRMPVVDYLVAAIAEQSGSDIVVWHLDRDLARLCEFMDQPHEQESAAPG